GDRVGGVVEPVDVVEEEGDRHEGDHHQQGAVHDVYACLTMTPSSRLATSSHRSVAASRKSKISFHLMTAIGSRSWSNSSTMASWCSRSASCSSSLTLAAISRTPSRRSSAATACEMRSTDSHTMSTRRFAPFLTRVIL